MASILEFKNMSYSYLDGKSTVSILSQCHFTFEEGKVYAIVGPSGSGKTTAIVLAGGLDQPNTGEIYYENENLQKIGLTNYRKKDVAIVFQSYNLIYYMNAYENVLNAVNIANMNINSSKTYILDILKNLGLDESQCMRDIRKLSGGQQRVAIGRAIAKDTKLILADEPTGNLDEKNAKEILKIFLDLAHLKQKCVLIVTHSNTLADQCDVKLKIQYGQFIVVN
ncbi:MAG: ABC transporter ATP-binding protein [Erysipelotrichaceae bacterium]|nr:ABC transporter ATP-binding protein [Erysipelotrichaceae bacterium]